MASLAPKTAADLKLGTKGLREIFFVFKTFISSFFHKETGVVQVGRRVDREEQDISKLLQTVVTGPSFEALVETDAPASRSCVRHSKH